MKISVFMVLHVLIGGNALVSGPAPAPQPGAQPIRITDAAAWMGRSDLQGLRPVPLGEQDTRFSAGFPGVIARFTDGDADYIVRRVLRPTRSLHAASTCFRASGYAVAPQPVYLDPDGRIWGRFVAVKSGQSLEVTERIADDTGTSWYDVSSWYWAAALGRTAGPWHAVTTIRAIP